MNYIELAQQVLNNEAKALLQLATDLEKDIKKDFLAVIEHILNIKGRVVLTGMGKSGHIAKKIAATLASTGTPAFFIHPAEASHGDLGMLAHDDFIIALSKSGESAELVDILHFAARYALPVVAITSNPASTLSVLSQYTLRIPDMPEACPLGCAPTTSTTLMLALGDALALTLLYARGFTSEDFNKYHPGGHLGKKLLLVRDIMHTEQAIPLSSPHIPMSEALIEMTRHGFGCLGITENKELIGIITDGDLRRNMNANLLNQTAESIMMKNPLTIKENTAAAAALQLMNEKQITSLFVLKDKTPVGIVHIHDCLRAGVV